MLKTSRCIWKLHPEERHENRVLSWEQPRYLVCDKAAKLQSSSSQSPFISCCTCQLPPCQIPELYTVLLYVKELECGAWRHSYSDNTLVFLALYQAAFFRGVTAQEESFLLTRFLKNHLNFWTSWPQKQSVQSIKTINITTCQHQFLVLFQLKIKLPSKQLILHFFHNVGPIQ